MTLKDLIESDVAEVFFNTDEFAERVTYHQGDLEAISIDAIPETIEMESLGTEGYVATVEQAAWQIPASQLGSVLPRDGDKIRRPVGGAVWVYEVTPPDDVRPSWTRDVTTHVYTVFTKRVA